MTLRLTPRDITRMLRDYFSPGPASALVAIALLITPAGSAHAEWFAGAQIREVFDNNVNLAADYGEMKSDATLQSSVSAGHYFYLSDSTRLDLTAEAKYSDLARFNGLDNLESGLAASLKYKRGLGSYAPWVRAFGSAAYADFRENFRDGNSVRSGLTMGKRLYDRVFARLGYEYDTTSARNSRFGTRNSIVSARIDYLLTETVQTWIGYARSRGTYAIYITRLNIPGAVIVDTFKEPTSVFQVRATAQALSLGASKSLADRWSADVSADFADIYSAARDRHYPVTRYGVGIVYAY